MKNKKLSPLILFIIGSLMHFLYDLSGKNTIVGLIAPVNESVWEHTKMVLLPVICWWTFYYIIKRKQYKINKNKWFTGALVALLTSIISIPVLHYFYTQSFGVELLVVDIIILFLALLFGQLLGLHFTKHSKGINSNIVILIFVAIIITYIIFTLYPPRIPLFRDSMTGKYGI
ncbi:DUF6512 family protein [Proteiniborus sp.]|uniref:DUF6512 family protein n=1 Tax=Proteiniborus sp. TaxID=2079015 RepID=UPI003318AF69